MYRSAFILILLGAICCRDMSLSAQEVRDTAHEAPPTELKRTGMFRENPPIRLERLEQDAIILLDPKTGRRQIGLPNAWTPELIDAIGQYLLRDQQNVEPAYTIHEINAQGSFEAEKVRVDFQIRATSRDEPVVRIPLGLQEGVLLLTEAVGVPGRPEGITEYQGDGVPELIVDPTGGGYVALIRNANDPAGEPDLRKPIGDEKEPRREENGDAPVATARMPSTPVQPVEKRGRRDLRHFLKFTLWFPVQSPGEDESTLAISFPSAVRSQFMLSVPQSDAIATAHRGTLLNAVLPLEGGGTGFDLRGLKNDFEISWRRRKPVLPVEDHTILSVEGATILARFSEDRIDYEAILPVRRHGANGLLDSFRVKLPPGVQLLQEQTPDTPALPYTITRLTPLPVAVPGSPEEGEKESAPDQREERNSRAGRDDPHPDRVAGVPPGPAINPLADGTLGAGDILSTDDAAGTTGNRGTEIEVRMLDRIPGVFNFPLRAVKLLPPDALGEQTDELTGFEVVGADKQTGVLSIELPSSDRRLAWRIIRGIERSEPPEVVVAKPNETRFAFHTQPFRLQVQVRQPRTRINVRPEYAVYVEKDRLRLNAKLSYAVYGSKTETLRVRLSGWNNPEIAPFTLVDVARVRQEGDLLLIPLQAPQEGSIDLELNLSRPLPALNAEHKVPLRFELPIPEADSVGSATIAVLPADCIQLFPRDPLSPTGNPDPTGPSEESTGESPDSQSGEPEPAPGATGSDVIGLDVIAPDERITGLTRTGRRSLQLSLPDFQQAPLVYQGDAAGSVFVADVLYRRRQVTVSSNCEIRLLDPADQIRQTLNYTIAYERMDDLYLYVPRLWDETRRWHVYLDGQFDRPLEARTVPTAPEERIGPGYVKKRIPLERIGHCSVHIVATIDRIDIARDFSLQTSIPFALPAEPELWARNGNDPTPPGYEQTLDFVVRKGIDITFSEQASSGWKPEKSPLTPPGDPRISRFRSRRPEESIGILVAQEDRDAIETTVIDRAWIQSWISDTVRADYFTFRFSSAQDGIVVHVPEGVGKGRVAVRLDGERVAARLIDSGEIFIPLEAEDRARSHTVELWYKLPRDSRESPTAFALPHFDSGVLVRCMYWQLILPRSRHLVGAPDGWTPEYRWGWAGLFLGRFPVLSQEDIGLRAGSAPLVPVPGETNRYLLSSLQQRDRAEVHLIDRGTLVLLGSGIALLAGLILIYVPQTRYPGSLFALGTVLMATFLYRPAPMLLLLQASILGILLALVAFYLDRLFRRQDPWKPLPGRASSVVSASVNNRNPSEVYSVIVDETDEKTGGSRS